MIDNNDLLGYLVKSDGEWCWLQMKEASGYKREILNAEILIAITKKLKELNGCSDVRVEIARLEQRLGQLEMTNTVNFTYAQRLDVAKEINVTRRRLLELS